MFKHVAEHTKMTVATMVLSKRVQRGFSSVFKTPKKREKRRKKGFPTKVLNQMMYELSTIFQII